MVNNLYVLLGICLSKMSIIYLICWQLIVLLAIRYIVTTLLVAIDCIVNNLL